MKTSQYLINTFKETPSEAEVVSHQLMLRSGMIKRVASGLYTWMPLGLRVLRNVEAIIREEMEKSGAIEVLMPIVQPADLWNESGRWQQYGPELLRVSDRHQRDFCLGPTHEEVITDLVRNEINSYKQLPINLYQIQTKFRDEIRPRFGVMRAREFLMKDAYSFHLSESCLENTYQKMFDTYTNIFKRIGVDCRPVKADTGSIGGNVSHEFHVLADSGEDDIAFSSGGSFASNVELAASPPPQLTDIDVSTIPPIKKVDTPSQKTLDQVSEFFGVSKHSCVKTLLVNGVDTPVVALILRGDHELNEIKAEKLDSVASPLTLASAEMIEKHVGCQPGFIGPYQLNNSIPIIVDASAYALPEFICGANSNDVHLQHVSWMRDFSEVLSADIRNVVDGDLSPDGDGVLTIKRGIEVGHIFQLGEKYTQALNVSALNDSQKKQTLTMGCYGIGVSRIVAAVIEQHHDESGIIWPKSIAPFNIAIAPINYQKSDEVQAYCDTLYCLLKSSEFNPVLFDEKQRLGSMLTDIELIGIPYCVIVGAKGLDADEIEVLCRKTSTKKIMSKEKIFDYLNELLQEV
jgi:prolyl-tRNA synthetase